MKKPENITDVDWQLLTEKYPNNLNEITNKIQNGYPIQYAIGYVDFLNAKINVNNNVLIPRFETEFLVDRTLKIMKEQSFENPKVLDIGTGSGCIAIAIKKNFSCQMTGIDISEKAISLAKENSLKNNVDITFKIKDIKDENLACYDVIISNPPYVSEKEPVGKETKYEPQNAIFASNDGLYFYELILKKIGALSIKPKLVSFEIGMTQGKDLIELSKKYVPQMKWKIEKDLANKNRYFFLQSE